MKNLLEPSINRWRDREWELRLCRAIGHDYTDQERNGCFLIPAKKFKAAYGVIACSAGGWDHISAQVHRQERLPTWLEMCMLKEIFFHRHEVAIQYHPAEEDYINDHPRVLHIWRPLGLPLPMPPKEYV